MGRLQTSHRDSASRHPPSRDHNTAKTSPTTTIRKMSAIGTTRICMTHNNRTPPYAQAQHQLPPCQTHRPNIPRCPQRQATPCRQDSRLHCTAVDHTSHFRRTRVTGRPILQIPQPRPCEPRHLFPMDTTTAATDSHHLASYFPRLDQTNVMSRCILPKSWSQCPYGMTTLSNRIKQRCGTDLVSRACIDGIHVGMKQTMTLLCSSFGMSYLDDI